MAVKYMLYKALGEETPFEKLVKQSKPYKGDLPAFLYKATRRQKPDEDGWLVIGTNENGALVQKNLNTGEIRILTEWVEIFKTPLQVKK